MSESKSPARVSGCRVGSPLWFGDVKRSLFANLISYGGKVWLLTVTAPGADLLPWDPDTSQVEQHAAHEWNRSAAKRWRELHRWARQATERAGFEVSFLARVWQLQRRGVLHLHLVVGVESPAEHAAARYYVAKLRERSAEFGFGFIDARDRDGKTGRSTLLEPYKAANYLSRYLGESGQLVSALRLTERPSRLIWISRELTSKSTVTMRRLRRVRFLYVIRTSGRGVLRYAGELPAWFRDPLELARISALLDNWVVSPAP